MDEKKNNGTKEKNNERPDWMPKRAENISRFISALPPGTKWVFTITVRDDVTFFAPSPLGEIMH